MNKAPYVLICLFAALVNVPLLQHNEVWFINAASIVVCLFFAVKIIAD